MKKYGKYEKCPEGVPKKQPKAKSALLQTYFTSLLCLVICVVMFFGTTYAWFTSEVNNVGNEIYIGTLDAELEKQVPDGDDEGTEPDYVSLSEKDSSGNNTNKLFDSSIRWEPGYTALETIRVVNKGDLAFKYVLNFTDGKVNGEPEEVAEIASHFAVYVYEGALDSKPENFDAITAVGSRWTPVMNGEEIATLADILTRNIPVITGNITDVRTTEPTATQAADAAAAFGPNDSKDTEKVYTIALHMNEDASNDTDENGKNSLMGKIITLNVKLTAYQMVSEEDAFAGNYDQMVSTAGELAAALKKDGTVALAADIDLADEQITVPAGVTATLDLNGHNLTADYSGAASGVAMIKVTNGATLTVEGNGDVTATTRFTTSNNYGAIFSNAGNLNINGGNYCVEDKTSNENTWIIACVIDNLGYACDGTTTINGGTFTVAGNAKNIIRNRPQHSGTMTLTINGGTFKANSDSTTYIWNHVDSGCTGLMNFNGGTYDAKVVYEDYNGQSDVYIAEGVTIQPYSGNN